MKGFIIASAAVAILGVAAPAEAQRHGGAETVFSCAVRGGKTVTVTNSGGTFTYRYGTRAHPELTLTGGARTGNLHFMRQRYAGVEMQLRFTRGAYSYIVYAMEGNGQTGTNPVSGLVVMRGSRRISEQSCTHYTDFASGFDALDALPQDNAAFTAM
jgi:hypothetical protein